MTGLTLGVEKQEQRKKKHGEGGTGQNRKVSGNFIKRKEISILEYVERKDQTLKRI